MAVRVMVVVLLASVLGASGEADALCNCSDIDGCSSAAACLGKSPGDTCTPPTNATCKIVKGNAGDLACCCGCSRGAGPLSCVFDPVVESLRQLDGATCGSVKLTRASDKAVDGAVTSLEAGQKACTAGKTKRVPRKLGAARKKLEGVDRKLDRLVEKGEIDQACANGYRALAAEFLRDIDDLGSATPPGSVTTTTSLPGATTTTTMPSSSDCSGTFTFFPSDANEVDMHVICPPGSYTGFAITPAQPRQITNFLTPSGFTCQVLAGGTWDCVGNFTGGPTPIDAGRIRTNPAPAAGMGGTMTVLQGASENGPFPVTGP